MDFVFRRYGTARFLQNQQSSFKQQGSSSSLVQPPAQQQQQQSQQQLPASPTNRGSADSGTCQTAGHQSANESEYLNHDSFLTSHNILFWVEYPRCFLSCHKINCDIYCLSILHFHAYFSLRSAHRPQSRANQLHRARTRMATAATLHWPSCPAIRPRRAMRPPRMHRTACLGIFDVFCFV